MKVVILAGGKGSRLGVAAEGRPKPMVNLNRWTPLVWHIIKNFLNTGHTEIVMALGYKADKFHGFFRSIAKIKVPITRGPKTGCTLRTTGGTSHDSTALFWLVDTGEDEPTGRRLAKLKDILGNSTFMVTYGDGLSNVNPNDVIRHHRKTDALVTITAVHPPSRFGDLDLDGDTIVSFQEKEGSRSDKWINGGFMVMEPEVLGWNIAGSLENSTGVLQKALEIGRLSVYKHEGFWQCVDYPDELNRVRYLMAKGQTPWLIPREGHEDLVDIQQTFERNEIECS